MGQIQSAPFVLYDSAARDFVNGGQDWDTDDHYIVLLASSYVPSTSHSTFADISAHECSDPDYDRQDMVGETATLVSGTTICDAADVNFGSSVTITARYCAIVVGTVVASSGTDKLVGYMLLDKSDADAVSVADNFGIAWHTPNGVFTTKYGGASFSVTEVPVISEAFAFPSATTGVSVPAVADQFQTLQVAQAVTFDDFSRLIDIAFEADYGMDESDGGTVDVWESLWDSSVYLNQSTATWRPTYRASAASNGLPSVEFDTTTNNKFMEIVGNTILGNQRFQPNTIILVAELVDTTATQSLFGSLTSYDTSRIDVIAGPLFRLYAGLNGDTAVVPDTNLHFYAAIFEDSNSVLRVDGTTSSTINSGTNSFTAAKLGDNTNGCRMYVHGFYISHRKLSEIELDNIQAYCQIKWSTP